jgi:phosphodiesterase/alkaline phosphatase D-like protein
VTRQGSNVVPDLAVDNTSLSSAGNIYHLTGVVGEGELNGKIEAFNSVGSPLGGQFPVVIPMPRAICGAAVDSDGHIWLSDVTSQSVKEYSSSGSPLGTSIPISAQPRPCRIAFDNLSGDMYVASNASLSTGAVWRYTAASGFNQGNEIYGTSAQGIDVDSEHGVVYVTAGGSPRKINAYNADGAMLEAFDSGFASAIAVDETTGTLYVLSENKVNVYPGVVIPDVSTEGVAGTTVSASIDPVGGGDVTSCEFQYGTSAAYGNSLPCNQATPLTNPTTVTATLPVTPEVLYHYRVVAGNANGTNIGLDRTFIPHHVVDLKTEPASALGRHAATLNASYVGTSLDTHYYFEWGPTTSYGNTTALPPGDDDGIQTGPQSVSAGISGLQSDSTYHYRVIASNSEGTSVGQDRSFETANAVTDITTGSVTGLTGSTATLHGSWTGDGSATNFYFEWGFTDAYGNSTAPPPGDDGGSGLGTQNVSADLTALAPVTTYHYRIVASNPDGTSYGADEAFTTPQLPSIKYLTTMEFTTTSAEVRGTVNPQNTGATTYRIEYGTDANYGQSTPESVSVGSDNTEYPVSAELNGLSPGTTYHYRIVATSPSGISLGSDHTFTTVPNLPTVADASSSGVSAVAAVLNARVRPGFGPTIVYFQYGPTSSYGANTVPGAPLAADDAEHAVSASLSGLSPSTNYHYRAVALNFAGVVVGVDQTFTTAGLPVLVGGSASGVTETQVTLSAAVNPSLAPTTFHFDYGKDASYGQSTPESVSIGSDDAIHPVSVTVGNLSPGTTYHYRVVATNPVGSVTSTALTFTTVAASAPPGEGKNKKCRKGQVKRRGKCVKKRAKKRHRPKRQTRRGR